MTANSKRSQTTDFLKSDLFFAIVLTAIFAILNDIVFTCHEVSSMELDIIPRFLPLISTSLAIFLMAYFGKFPRYAKVLISLSCGFFYFNCIISSWVSFAPLVFTIAALLYQTRLRPISLIGLVAFMFLCTITPESFNAPANILDTIFSLNKALYFVTVPIFELSIIASFFYLYSRYLRLSIYFLVLCISFYLVIIFSDPGNSWIYSISSFAPLILYFGYWGIYTDKPKIRELKLLGRLELSKYLGQKSNITLSLTLLIPIILTIPSSFSWAIRDISEPFSYSYALNEAIKGIPSNAEVKIISYNSCGLPSEEPADNWHFVANIDEGYVEYGNYTVYYVLNQDNQN